MCTLMPAQKGYDNHHLCYKPPDRKLGWTAVWVNWVVWWHHAQKWWSRESRGFWKDSLIEFLLLKRAAGFFGSEEQIIFLGLDRQRWIEILTTRCTARWRWDQHRIVSIGFYHLCLSPHVAKDWSQKLINPFVSKRQSLPVLLLLLLLLYINTLWAYNTNS